MHKKNASYFYIKSLRIFVAVLNLKTFENLGNEESL